MNTNEIKYTINTIMNIAFPKLNYEFINFSTIKLGDYIISFNIMSKQDYKKLIDGNLKMIKIDNFDNTFEIPVFSNEDSFYKMFKNKIIINADILTLSFLLLSRKEEIEIPKFDEYGRFIFKESLSYKYNLIDFPIVDEYAMLLREVIVNNTNIKMHANSKFSVYLTHDIDTLYRFGNLKQNIKTIIGGDLLRRKNLKLFFNSIKKLKESKKDNRKDPKTSAIYKFIKNESNLKCYSKYFFLAYNKEHWDYRYDINDKRISPIIDLIKQNRNMEYGLHCGFNAYDNFEQYSKQYDKLKSYGDFFENRNHYLRYDAKITPQILEKCGIKKDYSLGYHERTGFKCGTCHSYNLYDLKNNKVCNVVEYPLIVMDGSLKAEMKFSCEEAYKMIINYYNLCKRLKGNFIILWHPDSCIRVYMKFILFLKRDSK